MCLGIASSISTYVVWILQIFIHGKGYYLQRSITCFQPKTLQGAPKLPILLHWNSLFLMLEKPQCSIISSHSAAQSIEGSEEVNILWISPPYLWSRRIPSGYARWKQPAHDIGRGNKRAMYPPSFSNSAQRDGFSMLSEWIPRIW